MKFVSISSREFFYQTGFKGKNNLEFKGMIGLLIISLCLFQEFQYLVKCITFYQKLIVVLKGMVRPKPHLTTN